MCGGLGVGWEREDWQTENYRDYDILKCCITNKQVQYSQTSVQVRPREPRSAPQVMNRRRSPFQRDGWDPASLLSATAASKRSKRAREDDPDEELLQNNLAAAAAASVKDEEEAVIKRRRDAKMRRVCQICMVNDKDSRWILAEEGECIHGICAVCAEEVLARSKKPRRHWFTGEIEYPFALECPMCRARVTGYVRIEGAFDEELFA